MNKKNFINKIIAKFLMFFAGFLITKNSRHKCKTLIKKLLLVPSNKELQLWQNIMNDKETLQYIIDNKCSLTRYGDGESGYMLYNNFNHFFQPYNKNLQEKLKHILLNSNNNCLIALPRFLNNKADSELTVNFQAQYWYGWEKYKKSNVPYGSAHCFFGKNFINGNLELMKRIWQNRNIVFITGRGSTFVWIDELFNNSKSHKFIYTKAVDAFSEYDKIIEEVLHYNKDSLILIALGVTATALAYDLSKLGYQAIDIGHITNHYLTEIKGLKHVDTMRLEGKYIDGITDINKIIEESINNEL